VPNFDKGEHCSTPRSRVGWHQEFRAAICAWIDEWLWA